MRPGTGEIWIGDVGWRTGKRSTGSTNPTAGVTNFGWPCCEGAGRQSGYDGANLPPVREPLHRGRVDRAVLRVPARHARWWRGRPARRWVVDVGPGVLPEQRRRLSGVVPGGAVLRRLLPHLHLGDAAVDRGRPAEPGQPDRVRRRLPPTRSTSPSVPAAICTTWTRAARIRRIRYFAGNQPPTAVLVASPTVRHRAADRRTSTPAAPPTRTRPTPVCCATSGISPTTARWTPPPCGASFTYPPGGPFTRAAAGRGHPRRQRHADRGDPGRQHPARRR